MPDNTPNSLPKYRSPLEMLYHWESNTPDAIYLRQPINDVWHTWTWKEAGLEIRKMAAALKAMRMPLHSHIAIISKNCAHWIMCDLAIMMAGHVSVPLYPNLTAGSVRHILDHCDAPLVFVGKLDDWDAMKDGVPAGMQCISFPFYGPKGYLQWDKLVFQHQPLQGEIIREDHEPGTLIYTSGSTGAPKGVMHKIGNFGFASENALQYMKLAPGERFFSYLPLAHIGERFFVEMGGLYSGGEVWFAESVEKFQDNVRTAKPTIFLGVHRIWKKIQEGIFTHIPEKRLNFLLKIPIISGIIRKKIRKGLGFEHTHSFFTSAAPTPADLLLWYKKIGIVIAEAWAMTETFAYGTASLMRDARIGAAGYALPLAELKLSEDGELLVKHPSVMDGYYKDAEQTREVFTEDGFLKTGDRAVFDSDGYMKIIGRTKEQFKTSKGKFVVPSPIEMKVGSNSDIEMSCVTGSSLPQPIVIVTLTETGRNKDKSTMAQELARHIHEINAGLDQHEKIQKVIIVDENWTVENNMLTPTLKLKRREVEDKYASFYDGWYSTKDFVLNV
ncbi:MAG TPA: AMP-binding protein [Chitinophagaceae bacterium]|nr:AMP-binding protein [Chitinophagaceae bacterium]